MLPDLPVASNQANAGAAFSPMATPTVGTRLPSPVLPGAGLTCPVQVVSEAGVKVRRHPDVYCVVNTTQLFVLSGSEHL